LFSSKISFKYVRIQDWAFLISFKGSSLPVDSPMKLERVWRILPARDHEIQNRWRIYLDRAFFLAQMV